MPEKMREVSQQPLERDIGSVCLDTLDALKETNEIRRREAIPMSILESDVFLREYLPNRLSYVSQIKGKKANLLLKFIEIVMSALGLRKGN